jgi:selenocysteine lyase/cysteine desulfurase
MSDFLAAYPDYATTSPLDELRATEYSYLDAGGHTYLDYTGAGLAADAQLRAHAKRLRGGCFGNPHSENPTSSASTQLIEQARAAVLGYFNASAAEYAVIFTQNATGACRLVGEAYPFRPMSRLVLTADNHNSVNGIREFARARGAATRYIRLSPADLRVAGEDVTAALGAAAGGAGCSPTRRRATSAASSTRSAGLARPRPRATTCCSTRSRSSRPAGSTWARSSPSS